MINNRQAGRRRGRGGNNGGGNGPRPNGGGQRDNGNRIDSRARGNANQLYEKYKNLAADAQRQGDRVNTEYYLQFADHYFRVLSETRSRFEEQNQRRQRDDGMDAQPFTGSFDTGFDGQDDDYADEGEPIRPGEQAFGDDRGDRGNGPSSAQQPRRDDRQRDGQQRDDRQRDGQQRDSRPRSDDQPREQRPRGEHRGEHRAEPRADHRRPEPQSGDQGDERIARDPAERDQPNAPRQAMGDDGDGFVRRPRRQREDRAQADDAPGPRMESQPAAPAVEAPAPAMDAAAESEAPRRRGRPRRERPADEAPAAFDATLLPPSLGVAPAAAEAAMGEAPAVEDKPRRRRVRATPAPETTAG